MHPQLYTVEEAAQVLGVHPETVRRMIRRRQLAASRTNAGRGGGGYRIAPDELNRLLSPISRDAQAVSGRPRQLRAQGKYLLRSGDRMAAQRCYESALDASIALSDEIGESKARYKLAQIAAKDGRYRDAERHLKRALEISQAREPQAVPLLRVALGDLALRRDDLSEDEALSEAEAHFTAAAEQATKDVEARASSGLATVALRRGARATAARRFDEAFRLVASSGDQPLKADINVKAAALDADEDRPGEAIYRLEQALWIYDTFGFTDRAADVRRELESLKTRLPAPV